ncbi:MAG: PAS domain S-box protein [bacterium]
MVIIALVRIIIILTVTVWFFIFTRRLSKSPLQGYTFIGVGLTLLMLNLVVGAFFHSTLLSEEWREELLPFWGYITGYVGQTLGLILLLIGTYRLVRSLQPHLDAHYSSLVEHALVGVYLIQDGVFKFVNPRLAEISGYERKELIGKPILDCVSPQDRDMVAENIRRRITAEAQSLHYELTALKKNGDNVIVEVYGSRTIYKGKPAIHGTLMDITDRKRAEEELRVSEERFRVLANSTHDIICETTADGRFLYLSPNIKEVLGYSPKDILGNSLFNFIHPEDSTAIKKEFDKAIYNFTAFRVLFRCQHKNGEWRWFESAGKPYKNTNGEVRGIAVCRDISERKKLEEEILKASKLESLGVLAGGIAHDFNNILTAILGNVSLAKIDVGPKNDLFTVLADAENACLQAMDLTQQLLTFSRGGAPVKKTASISELIKDTVEFTLRGSNVKCEYFIPDDIWPVEIDEGQMSQVINNLIINADQAMPEGGNIKIWVENLTINTIRGLPLKSGNYVKISFEDQGVGIPKEFMPKIFDPYFTTKQKGSGLGLATSYSIIKNHDGLITVESRLGVGTTFHIYLPASRNRFLKKKQIKKVVSRKRPFVSKGRILVMDDELAVRKSVCRMLNRIGYEVELAEDGTEAIELYKKAKDSGLPFDAVLMDLTIPGGMGGKEAIHLLNEIDSNIKAIVSSGYSNDPVISDFKNYGFRGVVAKPFEINSLCQVLEKVILNKNK